MPKLVLHTINRFNKMPVFVNLDIKVEKKLYFNSFFSLIKRFTFSSC